MQHLARWRPRAREQVEEARQRAVGHETLHRCRPIDTVGSVYAEQHLLAVCYTFAKSYRAAFCRPYSAAYPAAG